MLEEPWYVLHLLEKVALDTTLQAWTKDKGLAKREHGDLRASTSSRRDATDHKEGSWGREWATAYESQNSNSNM